MDYIEVARRAILDLGSEDYYHLADAAAYLPSVPVQLRRAVAREAMFQRPCVCLALQFPSDPDSNGT